MNHLIKDNFNEYHNICFHREIKICIWISLSPFCGIIAIIFVIIFVMVTDSQIEPSQPEILPKPPGPGIKHCPLPCVVM